MPQSRLQTTSSTSARPSARTPAAVPSLRACTAWLIACGCLTAGSVASGSLASAVLAAGTPAPTRTTAGAPARTAVAVGKATTASVAASPAIVASPAFDEVPGEREYSGRLIVRPRQDLSRGERVAALALLEAHAPRRNARTDDFVLTVAAGPVVPGALERSVAARLLGSGLFQYVCPDWTLYPCVVPNDPRFAEQWHHTTMKSAAAWDLHRADGASEVVIAVTDTMSPAAPPRAATTASA